MMGDRITPAAEKAKGKVKETAGTATNNDSVEADGRGDRASADMKQAGDRVGDAAEDAGRS